jgi:DNA repair protein RadC
MISYKSNLPVLSLKYTPGEYEKTKITNSDILYNSFYNNFNKDTIEYREEMIVLYMNSSNITLGVSRHSLGSMSGTLYDPKIIFTEALLCGATAIALAHNHPSGNVNPSTEDDRLTSMLNDACKIMNFRFIDHIIVVAEYKKYYSYQCEGKIN